jgi:subtilase family serine protease
MSLLFQRSPAQEKRLQKDLEDIQSPTSGRYHAWLTPTEFGARYGARPADVARASAWLEAQGLQVLGASPSKTSLSFAGTIGQVEHAFRTEVHRYDVAGQRHFALSRAPSVPASLGEVVAGLHGVHDFRPRPPRPPGPRADSAEGYALGPADFAEIYDVNPLYANGITGKGQSLAVVGESFYNHDNITAFRAAFNLDANPASPNVPIDVLVPNTGLSQVLDSGDVSESTLDMEWSGGIAKDAQVYFVYTRR